MNAAVGAGRGAVDHGDRIAGGVQRREVEAGSSTADLGEGPRHGLGIAPEAAILAGAGRV